MVMASVALKILLVDDDPEDRAIMQDAIELAPGKETFWFAEDGEDALSKLEEFYLTGNLPCLIVLDLNMPRMNGTQTLSHLKADERFCNIPVIIYSTSVNHMEKEKCMRLGAHSYIAKPVSFKESVDTASLFNEFCTKAE
jgi:CheY-like chemotaxis protein